MKEVHSWCVHLDVPPDGLYRVLADDERARSARFRFERDRRRYIVAHGVLRRLLGRYLGVRPEELRFERNGFGKPALTPAFDGRLRFNLSHSADVALVAVASDAEVGVDVERVRALPELADDPQTFLDGWTRNEACVKAMGRGLDEQVVPDGERHWSFFSLHPARGYVGALVIAGSGWRLRQFSYHQNRSNR
jgi:4'-phosphopantetheinyl transferase